MLMFMEFKYGIEYNLFLDFNIAKHIKNDIKYPTCQNSEGISVIQPKYWNIQYWNVRWQIYGRLVINFDKWADELMTYLAS